MTKRRILSVLIGDRVEVRRKCLQSGELLSLPGGFSPAA
jgi:hypothetical protein